MKKKIIFGLVLMALVGAGAAIIFKETSRPPEEKPNSPERSVPPSKGNMADDRPGHCFDLIRKACLAAGFKMGGHSTGKGLIMDCEGPLQKEESVPGVNLDPALVKGCRGRY